MRAERARLRTRIAFCGNFGTHNLGNECTLRAILEEARRRRPDAVLSCICPNPDVVSTTYDIAAFPLSAPYRRRPRGSEAADHRILRFLRRLFVRLPGELLHAWEAFRILGGIDVVIMPGTGMLGDFGIGPLDLHYEILKWSVIAKLRRREVMFVSVGSSPIEHPLSRWFVRTALAVADYRAYRDGESKACLARIGVDTSRDAVFPDLAFSLRTPEATPAPHGRRRRGVVGLGLMDYYGRRCRRESGEAVYREYVEKVSGFAGWLLEQDYTVRLVIGDVSYDRRVKADVTAAIARDGWSFEPGQLIDEPIACVEDLLAQLAATDLVVATRFHNVLLALMLNKPVVSISYDPKNDALMAEAGLDEYCQGIEELETKRLVDQFIGLAENAERLQAVMAERIEACRQRLAAQYRLVFAAS